MRPFKKRAGALRYLPLAAVLAGLCWVGNFTIGVHALCVSSPALPAGFHGFRIALVTDLHGRVFGKEHARLLSAVERARPDLIALVGDIADEYTDLQTLSPLFARLAAIAPCVYVTGNHEWRMKNRAELFESLKQAGITRLQNSYLRLTRGGETILLAGIDDRNGPADQKTPEALIKELRAAEGARYTILLCHRNDQLARFSALGLDLVLSGHAHGGVVRLPFVGAVFGTHYELFPDFTAGLSQQGRTVLAVSRGLGGSRRLPVRIGNQPEIPVVILCREQGGRQQIQK